MQEQVQELIRRRSTLGSSSESSSSETICDVYATLEWFETSDVAGELLFSEGLGAGVGSAAGAPNGNAEGTKLKKLLNDSAGRLFDSFLKEKVVPSQYALSLDDSKTQQSFLDDAVISQLYVSQLWGTFTKDGDLTQEYSIPVSLSPQLMAFLL